MNKLIYFFIYISIHNLLFINNLYSNSLIENNSVFIPGPPKAHFDFVVFDIGETDDIDFLANDIANDVTSISFATLPAHGVAELQDEKMIYTAPNYATTDSLQYVICDFENKCDSAWVHIEVLNSGDLQDDVLVANDDYVVIDPFITILNPVENDFVFPMPDFATVTIVESPEHGNAQILGQQNITYTSFGEPENDFLKYKICILTPDEELICDEAIVYFLADSLPPQDSCDDCVWAGDANNDGMVNMFDLLPIGLTFGEQGDPRPNASIEWLPQLAPDWNSEFEFEDPQTLENESLNTKYVDCDGNGEVSAEDTLAINQNFGYVHNKTNLETDLSPVSVYCVFGNDTLEEGQWVQADIFIASDNTPAENLYGTVFSIEYPTNIIDLQTIKLNLDNDGWLTANDPAALLMYRNNMAGQVDIGFTRTNKQTVSGYGKMATIDFKIIDNIDGKQQDIALNLKVKNAFGSNDKGELIQFIPENTEATVFTKAAIQNVDNNPNMSIKTYPNPAHNQLQVLTNAPFQKLELKNMLGQTVLESTNANTQFATLNIAHLPSGIYILHLEQKGFVVTQKIIVNK